MCMAYNLVLILKTFGEFSEARLAVAIKKSAISSQYADSTHMHMFSSENIDM